MAINLDFQYAFPFDSADDIVFNPVTGTLFLARNDRVTQNPRVTNWRIDQFSTTGQFISSFTSDELAGSIGLSVRPDNGNVLILDTRDARIAEFTVKGELARDGIDATYNIPAPAGGRVVPTGITYEAATNTIYAVDFLSASIYEISTTGAVLGKIDLSTTVPELSTGLQGIAIDPITNNFLLVQDTLETPGGSKVFEVTRTGQLVTSVDIAALTGFVDPEGISIDPKTRTLYAELDNDDPTGLKLFVPNRNRVLSFKIELDTFAGDTNTADNSTGDNTDNTFLGGGGNDTYFGLGGNDIIYGGLDNDTLNGNAGNDQVLCGAGNDFGRGGDGDDYVGGSTGDDILFGDSGNDNLVGGAGNDTINGNLGNDVVNAGDGNDLARGGRGNDYLGGDKGNDTLYGDEGFDTIDGGDGNDSILGGSGEDFLYGGLGNDTLIGGSSRDTFILASGTGTDEIADFTNGQDLIGLSGGLTFNQITFTQESVNNVITTAIRVAATGEILANVTGVAAASFTSQSFISA